MQVQDEFTEGGRSCQEQQFMQRHRDTGKEGLLKELQIIHMEKKRWDGEIEGSSEK